MADNKNQHFVPRCHFRPFTVDGEGRAINLYNLGLRRPISRAPVKNQCSGDYFYGEDKRLDDAIRTVEDGYGHIMSRLLGENPAITVREDAVLRRFIYLQHLRTEATTRNAAMMVRAMMQTPGADMTLPDFKQEMRLAVTAAMFAYARTMHIVDDLKLRLVRNRTGVPFITSDDPAVMTNRLHIQYMHARWRRFGSSTAGTIFILPLSPELCCLLFDGDIYSVSHRQGWVETFKQSDIEALNEHQFLTCNANIYFRDWETRQNIVACVESARARRLESSHTINHAILDGETNWGKKYVVIPNDEIASSSGELLVHAMNDHPIPATWPSFLRYRADRKVAYSNDTGAGYTRRWCLDQGFVTGEGYRRVRL